jgi:hypothetical protein
MTCQSITYHASVGVTTTSKIVYSQTAGTGLGKCANTTETANGKYVGEAIIEGENTADQETTIMLANG